MTIEELKLKMYKEVALDSMPDDISFIEIVKLGRSVHGNSGMDGPLIEICAEFLDKE